MITLLLPFQFLFDSLIYKQHIYFIPDFNELRKYSSNSTY